MKLLLTGILFLFASSTYANEMTLVDFVGVEEFEEYLQEIRQQCLDNSGGGSRAVSCFADYYYAWDYELNYYYDLLRSVLDDEEREKLRVAQLLWIENRDSTQAFNSSLSDLYYADKEGTMFVAIRSSHASRLMVPITKNRAILIKQWYEDVAKYQ